MTGSGQRVKKCLGRVGLGHGSKVQTQFHLWVGNMLLISTYVAHALRRWLLLPMQKNKFKLKRKLWPLPPRDDFRKRAYLCTAKRGLCFSWSHCLCLHCFSHLKLHYADKQEFSFANFHIFELHTHASGFSGSVKLQTATVSHFNLHTFVTLCWKLHACNHKCTIVHFLAANQMD